MPVSQARQTEQRRFAACRECGARGRAVTELSDGLLVAHCLGCGERVPLALGVEVRPFIHLVSQPG